MANTRHVIAIVFLALAPVWAQVGAVPAGAGNPYQRAGQLPARIMDFKAEPAAIQPGQNVTLTWLTENPSGVTIDPEPGRVTPRGVLQISPARTTTYTLTVRGPNNQVLTRALTVNVAGTSAVAEAIAGGAGKKDLPQLNGHPDLSGVYDFSGGGRGGCGGNAAAAPAGPELKPGAEKYKVVRAADDAGLTSDCMP